MNTGWFVAAVQLAVVKPGPVEHGALVDVVLPSCSLYPYYTRFEVQAKYPTSPWMRTGQPGFAQAGLLFLSFIVKKNFPVYK